MRVLGEDDRLTLSCMHNLGHLYLGQHRLSEAEKYLVPALEGHRRIFGRDDIDTLSSMSSVAALRLRQERYSEAEALSMEGIEIAQDALGPDHPEVLDFRNTLMNLYREQGRYEDGARVGQELLASCQRVFGPEKPNTAFVSLNLARLHMDAGQYVQAESLLADVAVWGREVMSERNFGSVLAHYGRVLTFLDRCAEAEGALLEARNSFENSLGPAHPATLSAEIWLAELYDAWHEAEPDKGYDAKAAQWRAKLEEANRMPGDDREVLESDDS
jgi:tetratricopeptide (TPR) repeat protein